MDKELLESVLSNFSQAMRQWRMYANDSSANRDIESDTDLEARFYKDAVNDLTKLREYVWGIE